MKSVYLKLALFLMVVLAVLLQEDGTSASKNEIVSVPEKTFKITGEPESVSARAFLIKDLKTGQILLTKSPEEVLPIASVTKLFSAWTVWQDFSLETEAKIISSDVGTLGEAGDLQIGQTYTFHELLFPLLLESANDAAATFERETQGEIINKMNERVKSLGGEKTNFFDASGLSIKNVSTADELGMFLVELYKQAPHILDITSLPRYVNEYGTLANNNPLLSEGYRGGKHGYTEEANRTFAGIFTEKFNDEVRPIVYVLLGSDDLKSDMTKIQHHIATQVTFE